MKLRAAPLVGILCIFFFCAGHLLIPRLGVEDDEALFVQGIYPPRAETAAVTIRGARIPTMMMPYVGALKTWIYWPILRWFGSGTRALREPMLLAGTAGLWLFFLLLRRIAGERAALIGCALLAVDAMYLLTVCFDWGPVALQHLLTIGGVLLVVRFYQEGRTAALAGGCFLLGLVLWDKALAIWVLSGMGVAALAVYPREIFRPLTVRRVAIAILFFALGALPLLRYNVRNHWTTLRGNFHMDLHDVRGKAEFLLRGTGGGGLFGWLTAEDWQTPSPHSPNGAIEWTSDRIATLAGHPRNSLLPYAFGLALLLAPLAGNRGLRIVAFCLIAMLVAWIQMAINFATGAGIHHTILLWPLPQAIIGVSFAAASRRLGRAGILAVAFLSAAVALSGVLVVNEYYVSIIRFGGAQAWNDGIFALSRYLKDSTSREVTCMDWGMLDQLRLLNRGALQLSFGNTEIAKPEMNDRDRAFVDGMIAQPGRVFLTHTPGFEFFKGQNARLVEYASAHGYRREVLATIADTFGRPVYEVYRFQ